MKSFLPTLTLMLLAMTEAVVAAPKVEWLKPVLASERSTYSAQVFVRGKTQAGTRISLAALALALEDHQNGQAGIKALSLPKEPLASEAGPDGTFELRIPVPIGVVHMSIVAQNSKGEKSDYQISIEVTINDVVQRDLEALNVDSDLAKAAIAHGRLELRGVDVRIEVEKAALNFTSVSGNPTQFDGLGSTVSLHFYWFEKEWWKSSVFAASRVVSFVGKNLPTGYTEGIQYISLAPGLELSYGPLYIQTSYHFAQINDFYVGSSPISRTIGGSGFDLAGGLNFRFNRIGLGAGVSSLRVPISASALGTTSAGDFKDLTYSLNFIYYIGKPPRHFLSDLF